MMHNSGYAQSYNPEIDNIAVNESSVSETNGFNNNFTNTFTRNNESTTECDDYSSFEDLLNIDKFITQTESNDNVGQCDGTMNASENSTNNNLNAPPSSDVSLALKESDSVAQADYKIDDQSNGSIDSDANSINANLPIINFEASSSLMQNLNTTEHRIDTPTVPATKSNKKHFPRFIKLYCEQCGESPWTTRYYSDQKCPACENKVKLRCCKCKQESEKYENMVYHLKTKCAPKDVMYKCSQCDYYTFLKTSLNHHMKSHEPSYNIKCPDCGISSLKHKRSLENHKRYHCPNRQHERRLKCTECYKEYSNELNFEKHRKVCFYAQKSGEVRLDEVSPHANT